MALTRRLCTTSREYSRKRRAKVLLVSRSATVLVFLFTLCTYVNLRGGSSSDGAHQVGHPLINWIHIAKTGTSFGSLLVFLLCGLNEGVTEDSVALPIECLEKFHQEPEMREAWKIGDHYSLFNSTTTKLGSTYAMIRSPKSRFPSGFHHLTEYKYLHASGAMICGWTTGEPLGPGVPHHFTLGHQVKVFAGHRFEKGPTNLRNWGYLPTQSPPSDVDLREAFGRIDRMAFVGITDLWETTVCLLSKRFRSDKNRLDTMLKMRHLRQGEPVQYKTVSADCGDIYDEALIRHVFETRFAPLLEEHHDCRQIFMGELHKLL